MSKSTLFLLLAARAKIAKWPRSRGVTYTRWSHWPFFSKGYSHNRTESMDDSLLLLVLIFFPLYVLGFLVLVRGLEGVIFAPLLDVLTRVLPVGRAGRFVFGRAFSCCKARGSGGSSSCEDKQSIDSLEENSSSSSSSSDDESEDTEGERVGGGDEPLAGFFVHLLDSGL